MKNMTQAWGWLAAGVLAAGLNASYHEGGLQWAHQLADQAECRTAAALALASGQAEQFLAEARLVMTRDQTASCRLDAAMARLQTGFARAQANFAHAQAMSDRQQAQLDRMAARRDRVEAQIVRIRIPAVALNQVALNQVACRTIKVSKVNFPQIDVPEISVPEIKVSAIRIPAVCPRMSVNVPRPPMVKMPVMRVIQVSAPGAGPV